jgi:hypothetical protein
MLKKVTSLEKVEDPSVEVKKRREKLMRKWRNRRKLGRYENR